MKGDFIHYLQDGTTYTWYNMVQFIYVGWFSVEENVLKCARHNYSIWFVCFNITLPHMFQLKIHLSLSFITRCPVVLEQWYST
jgi:hypothetical protein